MKSYQSPPTALAGMLRPEITKPGYVGRTLGQQRLLHDAGFLSLAVHGFPLRALRLEAAGVVNCHGHVIAQRLKNSELLAGKRIQFRMRRGEDAHEAFADMKWDRHFGERGVFAANVVVVLAHVGGIAHLAGRSDIADHAFLANLQTMTFVVDAASVHAGHHHLAAFLVVQVDAGFHAAKGTGHVIHDVVDELIEVEDRSDLLRRLLQLLQVLYLIDAQAGERETHQRRDWETWPWDQSSLARQAGQYVHAMPIRCRAVVSGFFLGA